MPRRRLVSINADIQEGEFYGDIEIPHMKYIMKDEYDRMKKFEGKYHKLNEHRSVSIINRISLAALTFVSGNMLTSGLTNLDIGLYVLLVPLLALGYFLEFR
jgi:hypothetical protein